MPLRLRSNPMYGWDGTLLFVFGPTGAYFAPGLELNIADGYDAHAGTSESLRWRA